MKKVLILLAIGYMVITSFINNKIYAAVPEKIVITYVTAPLNVPSIVNKHKNIFDDALKKMGIKVEYAEITSGADQTQALASGDVQVLYAVGATSVILSAANGADIKVLNTYSRSPKAFCMYAKDNSIDSPKALKGKTIAGPVGTNLHELLVSYLEKNGMTIKDVNFLNMSIPNAKAALDGGKVDVALLAGATANTAKMQGYKLVTTGEGLIDAIIVVAVTEKFYKEHPEIIKEIKDSQKVILKYMNDEHEKTIDMVSETLGLDKKAVEEMYGYYDFSTEVTPKDKTGFQRTADFMFKNSMIENKLDTTTLFLQ